MLFRKFQAGSFAALSLMSLGGLNAQESVSSLAFSGDELASLQADFDNGTTIYDNACVACHGETGEGVEGVGPALTNNLSLNEIMRVIYEGTNTMPAFNVLSDQQLVDISRFVAERLKR